MDLALTLCILLCIAVSVTFVPALVWGYGVGAILSNVQKPNDYVSKLIEEIRQKYSIFKRIMYAKNPKRIVGRSSYNLLKRTTSFI